MKKLFLILFFISASASAVQIPYAYEQKTHRIVHAELADKRRGPFKCGECGNELILRQGETLAAHFAHKSDPNSTCGGGGPESWQHQLAKQHLSDHLERWDFIEQCSECPQKVRTWSFSSASSSPNEEYKGSMEYPYDRFFIDVMVLRDDIPVAALEVRHTHAVDEEKLGFFAEKSLPLLELDATEIIQAHDDGSFRVTVLKKETCRQCQELERKRNLRPCLQCHRWHPKSELSEFEAPSGHPYRTAFVCEKCVAECPDCNTPTTQKQIQQDTQCFSCNRKRKAKILLEQMEMKKARQQELERQEQLIREQALREIRIQQEKQRQENLEKEQKQKEEIRRKQEIEQKASALRRANEIISSNQVHLSVPYSEKESVKKFNARWNGGDNWSVQAKYLKACSRWFRGDPTIVPKVEALLEQRKSLKRKREDPALLKAARESHKISDFFRKK